MNRLIQTLVSLALAAVVVGHATARGDDIFLPHGPLTRLDFLNAKSLTTGDKNGELGDAAVTSDRYDMLRHTLDLRIDPAQRAVSGSVQMVFASEINGLAEFVCDLASVMVVDSVTSLSGPLVFTHLADSVAVVLPVALTTGQVDSLVVHYHGDATSPIYNRGLMFKTHFPVPELPQDQLVPIVANLSQPAYAQNWWPCKDRPDDKFTMVMNLTVPDTLVGVSNGTAVGEAAAEPGWRTFNWREDYPIATYLVSVAVSDYILLSEDCITTLGTDVPLRNWVFPATEANAVIEFAPLCSMVDFCESLYGAYPFAGEKYGHAEFLWPGAMEHQTVTSIGSGSLDGAGTHEWLVVHELAHQWFGDSLTPADWADVWLNEGFATYAEALWYEHTDGAAAYDTYLAMARNEGEWLSQGPVYDPMPIFPGRVIYDKGAWILHMLRGRMGDADFFGLVDDWANGAGRRLGLVDTQSFIDLAGSWAGEDLDAFLWPYLTTTALPVLAFDYQISEGLAGPDSHLRVSLSQRQSPLFDNIYPVVVQTSAGQTTLPVHLTGVNVELDFELGAAITQVRLDPEATLLWHGAGAAGPGEGLTRIFPNPSRGGYVVFRYWLENEAQLEVRVYDVMGRQVASRDLGSATAGEHEWGWDVTGDAGERIPSGVYWAALLIDGRRSVGKFAVVR